MEDVRDAARHPAVRRAPRALIRASAIVSPHERPASEHMTYDLSTSGVRLCGLPSAGVGDILRVRIDLPQRQVVASGRLVRTGATAGVPDFAIQFLGMSASDEEAIQDAVSQAFLAPTQRSVLLYRAERDYREARWRWLRPILSICASASTPGGAIRCLDQHPIGVGILPAESVATGGYEWTSVYRKIPWRMLDAQGRLQPLAVEGRGAAAHGVAAT